MTEGDVVTTYTYDDANWLQTVSRQDGDDPVTTIATFNYDAKGQRTKKTVGSNVTNYFYSGTELLYTKDGSGSIIEQNVLETDGSMICSRRNAGTSNSADYWYRQDIRGSVTNIVGVADAVVKSYTYDAYGNTSNTGTFVNSFAYTGAVIDPETGLYYMNARYYDPETGRFISQDTYRGDGEEFWHLYLYCDGDPVNNTDPTGHGIVIAGIAISTGTLILLGITVFLLLDQAIYQEKSFIGRLVVGLTKAVNSMKTAISYAKSNALSNYKKYKKNGSYEDHHIVPKGGQARIAFGILGRVGIGINSSPNIVRIKYAFHRFLNNSMYHGAIDRIINKAFSSGNNFNTRRSAVLVALYTLKRTLKLASDRLPI